MGCQPAGAQGGATIASTYHTAWLPAWTATRTKARASAPRVEHSPSRLPCPLSMVLTMPPVADSHRQRHNQPIATRAGGVRGEVLVKTGEHASARCD